MSTMPVISKSVVKRFLLSIVVSLFMAMLFTACGNSAAASTPSSSPSSPTTGVTPSSSNSAGGKTIAADQNAPSVDVKAAGPFTALRMLDQTRGWALSSSKIFKTVDAGAHWTSVTPAGGIAANSVGTFMDVNHAWIASVSQPLTSNTVDMLRTSDGGKNWQRSTIRDLSVAVLDSPHFVNLQTGWLEIINKGGPGAGNESAAIFRTNDGGQSWKKLVESGPGFELPGFKTGISFKDTLNGWATGHDASNNAILYVTHDGGQSWQPQTLPDLPGAIGTKDTMFSFETTPPVFFGNSGVLPVKVNGQLEANKPLSGLLLYATNDGGRSWFSYWKTQPGALAPIASDNLYIVNPQHGWASDNQSGIIFATQDGGKSWLKVSNSIGRIKTFSFVDNVNGWAITENALWRTSDGGRSWRQL